MNLSKMCFLHLSNREIHSSLLGLWVNYLAQHLESGKNTKKWGAEEVGVFDIIWFTKEPNSDQNGQTVQIQEHLMGCDLMVDKR